MNQAAKEDRYLHLAAVKTLKSIEQSVEKFPALLVPVLEELFGKFGTYVFDQRTNSKTVEKLLQWATAENAAVLVQLLQKSVVSMTKNSARPISSRRLLATATCRYLAPQALRICCKANQVDVAIVHVI